MSTQQDIYAAGSESRPPMLNKENYVPWSSRLLHYAKSRPNRKLIYNSIINGPYVRRMIPEPGDTNREIPVNETFHVQIDDELTEKELKQIKADDQAIQTILLGLLEDIYAAVDSYETAQEIWLRVQQMMKDFDIGIQEKKSKNKHFSEKIASNLKFLNNLQPEWSRHVTIVQQTKDLHTADYTQLYDFLKHNQKEVDKLKVERLTKIQDPLALIENSNNPYAFLALHQDQSSFNQNYMQQPMPNPKYITDPTTAVTISLALMAKAFKLNYSTPTNNNQRISSNPRNRQIAQPGMNMGQDRQMQMAGGYDENQFTQYAGQNVRNLNVYNAVKNVRNQVAPNLRVQNVGNQNGLIDVPGNGNQNGNGNLVAVRAEGNAAGHNGNQIRCYNCRGVGHFARDCTVMPRRRDAAYLQTQLMIAQKEVAGIQLQAEEFDLMAAAADHDEIEEVNANCILMANLQQPSTSGTQTDIALVYDSDGSAEVIHICLWCVDSGFSMHMIGNLKLLINFIWKFLGIVCFGNDHVAVILGFGDLQWENILITRVYFVEGLGHNLFSVGQFCDSDLEVAFRRNACFVRNLEVVDLLKGYRSTNLYTINLHEMASTSPICLMGHASSTKNDLVSGLPKFKYNKGHLCPSCEQGKSKRASHPPKPVPNSRQRLHLLHMDLCGPMRIASINGKRSGLDLTYAPSTITTQQPTEGELDLLFEAMYDDYIDDQPSATARTVSPAQEP
nr:copia protein [Tanacetum cinerariifolium]